MDKLHERMIQLRKEKGLSQVEVAEHLGMNKSTYYGYENEQKRPRYENIVKLAELYGVSTDYLIGTSEERNPIEPIFLGDSVEFEQLYNSAPAEIRPIIANCFTSFYKLIFDDIKEHNVARLREYSEMLETLSILRTELKKQGAELPKANDIPFAVSELMELQENLKTRVDTSLERLLQIDLNTYRG